MSSVVLIDGKNIAYRHLYTHGGLSHEGFPTGVLYGCIAGICALSKRLPDMPIVWVWDGPGKTWRHDLDPGSYKTNRAPKDARMAQVQSDLHKQLPELQGFLNDIGMRNFEVANLEGDDMVGMLAMAILDDNLFDDVIIHSADRDFYQFISDRVRVLKGLKGGSLEWADPRELEAEFRISFRKWTLFRAITGDKSDNIPQVFDGVGPVTAAEFIKNGINPSLVAFDDHPKKVKIRYGHPFQIRKKTVDFKGNWERIHLNYRLSRIVTDHTDECLSEEVRKALASLFKGMSYKSFYRKEECLDDFGWQKMTNFFVKHDMSDLMEKRQLLWRLP